MAARSSRSQPTNPQVKDSDVAANEALLAHAEFSRSVKSWLSVAAYGNQSDDNDDDRRSDKDETGEVRKKGDGLHGLRPAGEGFTSDMGGLGFIPPKDSSGRPVTTATDPTTAFLRKQLLGRTRPHHPAKTPPSRGQTHGSTSHVARGPKTGGPLKHDDSDEEDSRSGLGKAKNAARSESARASAAGNDMVEKDLSDDGAQTGSTTAIAKGSKQDQDNTSLARPKGPHAMLSARRMKRGTSYLDEVLAERARKKKKKQRKGS